MNEIIKPIFILGLVMLGTGFIFSLFDYLKAKVELSPTTKEKLEIIEKIIESSVIYVNQTFVDVLKENGDFDNEDKCKAFSSAKELIKEQLSDDLIKVINSIYDDVDTYLDTMIESYVSKNKMPVIIQEDIEKEHMYTELTDNVEINNDNVTIEARPHQS